jgi:hypothetical protein
MVEVAQALAAQALLPMRCLLQLHVVHSQEWLCYSTFSVATEACATKAQNPSAETILVSLRAVLGRRRG